MPLTSPPSREQRRAVEHRRDSNPVSSSAVLRPSNLTIKETACNMLMYFPRWTEVAKQLGIKFENLIGDVLVSSAVVAYLGAFTAAFRQVLCTL